MLFSTLGRYFFKRYVITAMWFFLGVSAIIFLADFSETNRRMSALASYTIYGALGITAMRVPSILQQTIPTLSLFIGMTTLIALNRRSELVVTRAAGLSVWQFAMPFAAGAFLLGVFTIGVISPLSAWGLKQSTSLESSWREAGGQSRASNFLPWIRQISDNEDTILGAKSFQKDTLTMVDVVLFHFDKDARVILRQDAATAKLENGYWLLNDVLETRSDAPPARLETAQVRTNIKPEFLQESLEKPENVAFFDLSEKIEVARSFGISTKGLETQFHSLLSLPLLLVAMTLIAATVSLKFSRMAQSRSVILGGIVCGFVLYVVTVLVKAFGSSGVVPPFVAVWIPVIVAMALGATILLHQEDG